MRILLSALVVAFSAGASVAQEAVSAYTSIAEKDCRELRSGEAFSTYRCRGHRGMAVLVEESDLRFSVSYGPRADEEPAAKQSFQPLQSLGEQVEWRVGTDGKAFAAILRWRMGFDDPAQHRQVLVVTRLPPGPVCWVALVDARANPEPNVLARRAADERARKFRCGVDRAAWIGERTAGIEGLVKD